MIELRPDEFDVVRPLFDGIEHSVALVHSVIEGNSPGRVFVDRRESPSSAYLIHEGAFHYVAGDPSNGEFNDAMIAYLFDEVLSGPEAQELVLFAFSEAWRFELDALLSPRGAKRIRRKTFAFYPAHFHSHAGWRESLPDGVCVQCIDERLANRNPDYTPLLDPRTQRFGFCVTVGDAIASACTAVAVGGGEVEIDIHTNETYRRQGHALRAACAFIEETMARGLRPNWSCWREREASCVLARKLGFEDGPDVPAHFWMPGM